jgi:hypothetical protein
MTNRLYNQGNTVAHRPNHDIAHPCGDHNSSHQPEMPPMPPLAQQLTADFRVITRTLVGLLNGAHGPADDPGLRDHLDHILLATEDAYQHTMHDITALLAHEPVSEWPQPRGAAPWTRDIRQGTFASALDSCDHLLDERDNPNTPIFRRAVPNPRHTPILIDLRSRLLRAQAATDRIRDYRRASIQPTPLLNQHPLYRYHAVSRQLKGVVLWSSLLHNTTLPLADWNFVLLAQALANLDAGTPYIHQPTGPADVLQIDISYWHDDVNPAQVPALVASDGTANPLEHPQWQITLLTAVTAARRGGATLTYTGECIFTLRLPEP